MTTPYTRMYRPDYGSSLEAAVQAALQFFQDDTRLLQDLGQGPCNHALNYFGIELPLSAASTEAELIASIETELATRAALYASAPTEKQTVVRKQTGEPGEHLSIVAVKATQAAQYFGNRMLNQSPEDFKVLRHILEFNGVEVAFNPWAQGESERLVAAVLASLDAQREAYVNSAEYKAWKAAQDAKRTTLSHKADVLAEQLPSKLKGSLAELVRWVTDYAECHDHVGVETRPDTVVAAFNAEGFRADAFVGPQYTEILSQDKDKLGRYIIGQFLNILPRGQGMPGVLWHFADEFHAMA